MGALVPSLLQLAPYEFVICFAPNAASFNFEIGLFVFPESQWEVVNFAFSKDEL